VLLRNAMQQNSIEKQKTHNSQFTPPS